MWSFLVYFAFLLRTTYPFSTEKYGEEVYLQIEPEVFVDKTYISVAQGEPLAIECSVKTSSNIDIFIKHDGKQLAQWSATRTRTFKFEINSAQESDSGSYVCTIKHRYGWSESETVHVIVEEIELSDADVSILKQVEYVGEENQTKIEIPCLAQQKFKVDKRHVKWFFNGTEIYIDNKTYQVSGHFLIINNLSKIHRGLYKCVVKSLNHTAASDVHVIVHYPPKLSETTNEEYLVEYGGEVSLNCAADAFPMATTKWKKPFETEFTNFGESLTISSFKPSDAGVYICELDNGIKPNAQRVFHVLPKHEPTDKVAINANVKKKLNIDEIGRDNLKRRCIFNKQGHVVQFDAKQSNVYDCQSLDKESPDIAVAFTTKPEFTGDIKNNDTKLLRLGDSETLTCPFNHFNYIEWFKDDELISNSNEIELRNISVSEHEGFYRCRVRNEAGEDEYTFETAVFSPPFVTREGLNNTMSEVMEGDSFIAECEVDGVPYPKIEWIQYEDVISADQTLYIDDINESYEGQFVCKATNEFGSVSIVFNLNVLTLPKILNDTTFETKRVLIGSNVTLECPFENVDFFEWYKDGEPFSNETFDLTFQNVSAAYGGVFTCFVQNEALKDNILNYTHELIVYRPTFFENKTLNQTTIRVIPENTFSIDCQVNGLPIPEIEWIHDGTVISRNKTLQIDQVDVSHVGKYICAAKNDYGMDNIEFNLDVLRPSNCLAWDQTGDKIVVHNPPMFESGNLNQTTIQVVAGSNYSTECKVKGYPNPKIVWTHGNRVVSFNESLILDRVNESNNGEYVCTAANEYGMGIIMFELQVV